MITTDPTTAADALESYTDAQWDEIERLYAALEELGGGSPSRLARKAKIDTQAAHNYLRYLVAVQEAQTSGNGAWTHYHPRAR